MTYWYLRVETYAAKLVKKTHQTAKNGANKTEESDGLVGSKSFVIFVFQRIIYGRPF